MSIVGKDLQRRLNRKWAFRYAAKVLEIAYKKTGDLKDESIEDLIYEMKRRGRISPCLHRAIKVRDEYHASRTQVLGNGQSESC